VNNWLSRLLQSSPSTRISNWRKAVRSAGGKYSVVKNKLAGRAAQGTAMEEAFEGFEGRYFHRLHNRRSVALAKAIRNTVADNAEQISVKGA